MTIDLFRQILANFREAPPLLLTLHLAGESLLAKNIFEMIRLAKEGRHPNDALHKLTALCGATSRRLIEGGSIGYGWTSADKERFGAGSPRSLLGEGLFEHCWPSEGQNRHERREADCPHEGGVDPGASTQRKGVADRRSRACSVGIPSKASVSLEVHNWAGTFAAAHDDLNVAKRRRQLPASLFAPGQASR